MKLKPVRLSIIALCGLSSLSALASEFNHGGEATIVSQYIFRGLDASQEDPALQAGYDVSHSSGFSAGIWGSNYDFGGNEDGVELDLIAGYSYNVNDALSFSAGVTEYTYSGDSKSTTEFNIGVAFSGVSATYYSDQDLDSDYIELGYELAFNQSSSLDFHAGRAMPDVGDDSNDFAITYSYSIKRFKLFAGFTSHDAPGSDEYFFAGATVSF